MWLYINCPAVKVFFFLTVFTFPVKSTPVRKLPQIHHLWPAREVTKSCGNMWTSVFDDSLCRLPSRGHNYGFAVKRRDHSVGEAEHCRQETWPAGWEGGGHCRQWPLPSGHGNMPYTWKSVSRPSPGTLTPPTYWGSPDSTIPVTRTRLTLAWCAITV